MLRVENAVHSPFYNSYNQLLGNDALQSGTMVWRLWCGLAIFADTEKIYGHFNFIQILVEETFLKKRVLYYVAKKFKSGKVYIFSFIWTHLNDSVLWILLPSLCLLVSWAAAASIQQSKDDQRENYQDKHSNDGNTTQCPRLLMHTMKEPLHPVLRWPCGFLLV